MLLSFFKLIRCHQYVKNGFIFLPALFAWTRLSIWDFGALGVAFLSFSFLASSLYVFNDIQDLDFDRQHPTKKHRPIAAGIFNVYQASIIGAVFLVLSFLLVHLFIPEGMLIFLAYLVLNISYSKVLKHIPILDIQAISFGFVLRVFVGGVVIGVPLSSWIVVMTFVVSFLLAASKRYLEIKLIAKSTNSRPILDSYSEDFLLVMMAMAATITLIGYLLYSLQVQAGTLYYSTSLFIFYGVGRYLLIVFNQEEKDDPTSLVLRDRGIKIAVILWFISTVWFLGQ